MSIQPSASCHVWVLMHVFDGALTSQALARQLQDEEDAHARELYQRRQEALERRRAEEARAQEERQRRTRRKGVGKGKKIKECVVM